MRTFVINLNRSVQRRGRMTEHLDALGLPHEFYSAVDGLTLAEEQFLKNGGGVGLTRGEVGCWLSHLAVWRKVANDGVDCALILEDDAQIDVGAMAAIRRVALHPECFDVVRLSAIEKQVGVEVATIDPIRGLVVPTKSPSGLAGYLISAKGASRLVKLGNHFAVPVDTAVDAFCLLNGDAVMMVPAPIQHASGVDSIITDAGRLGRSRRRSFFLRIFVSIAKRVHVARLTRKWKIYRKVICEV